MSNSSASSPSESTSVTPDPTPWIPHDHVRIMHLSSDGSQVLMCEEDGSWDFPYFLCRRSARCLLHDCCMDYQKSLGIKSEEACFTLLCELVGDACFVDLRYGGKGLRRPGKVQLLWVEQHIPSFELPRNHSWKDVNFVESLECDDEYDRGFGFVAERVAAALRSAGSVLEVGEGRYQIGWHDMACKWLTSVVERDGAEVNSDVWQYRVTFSSTTLVVNSSKGLYFLKAPLVGSGEMGKTCIIANIMPDDTLDIVGSSEELGAFVSRGFKLFYEKADEDGAEGYTNGLAVVKALGSFQLRSIGCRDRLLSGGVPLRDPETIIAELRSVKEDEHFAKYMKAMYPLLAVGLPYLEERFAQLREYNIPLVLTHGDYGRRNFAFKEGKHGRDRMILFDWQFGCISHPFFEFYDEFRTLGAELEPHVDEYLKMWSDFETVDRAREAFKLAQPVGCLLRAIDNLECLRAGQVEAEPPLASFAFRDLQRALDSISPEQKVRETMKAYRASIGLADAGPEE